MNTLDLAWLNGLAPFATALAGLLIISGVLFWQPSLRNDLRGLGRDRSAHTLVDAALALPRSSHSALSLLLLGSSLGVGIALLATTIGFSLWIWLVGPPLALAAAWGVHWLFAAQRQQQIDRDLTAAVGRLSTFVRGGLGLRQAFERVASDLDESPLGREWQFLVERQGVPLRQTESLATMNQVVEALALQTPSPRHSLFLDHLSVAVGQPQEVLARRLAGAYAALQTSERRREETRTELAQMRYSGMAVGLAGVVMAGYLAWAQWERVVSAYSSPLGVIVGVFVLAALLLPIVGGALLAQSPDLDY